MQRAVKFQLGQKTALFFGAGYCALHLAPKLQAAGYQIFASVRHGRKNAFLRRRGIEPLKFTGKMSAELLTVLKRAEVIVSSVPPLRGGVDPIISALPNNANNLAPNLKWAGYLSATSVYGDRGGQWAFEDELLKPNTARGRARVEAELSWLETGWPVHIFRLAGIYGQKIGTGKTAVTRNPLARLESGKARAVIKPGHIVNRIHVEDICTALMSSIAGPNPMRVYNIADGNPAPPQDVLNFGARLIDVPLPPKVSVDDDSVSEMARSFYKDNKRVAISRAKAELGFAPRYEDYRRGLVSLAQSQHPKHIYLAGHISAAEPERAAVIKALPQHIALSRAEKGCLRFDVSQDSQKPSKFHVFEVFDSENAFKAHQLRSAQSGWAAVSENCQRDYVIIGPASLN